MIHELYPGGIDTSHRVFIASIIQMKLEIFMRQVDEKEEQ